MRNIILYPIILISIMLFAPSCDSFKDAGDVKDIGALSAEIQVKSAESGVSSFSGLKLILTNTSEDIREEITLEDRVTKLENIIPGFYNIGISGQVLADDGNVLQMSGAMIEVPLLKDNEVIEILIQGSKISPLIFKEIFYSNYSNKLGRPYLFSQFYEIYNNSEVTVYLDGLHIADLMWGVASANAVSVWFRRSTQQPIDDEESGDVPLSQQYVYASRSWKIPGSGREYPLAPGESVVLVQRATVHSDAEVEADYTAAEFEFFMPASGDENDFAAPNMEHVHYRDNTDVGSLRQYLAPVAGPAMAIYRVPDGEEFEPSDLTKLAYLSGKVGEANFRMVPVEWVLDAVECAASISLLPYKRIPMLLDKGMICINSGNYSGESIARKKSGEIGEAGHIIYQDTNDSTEDFEVMTEPQLRRYGAKMPSWNHTLQN